MGMQLCSTSTKTVFHTENLDVLIKHIIFLRTKLSKQKNNYYVLAF